MRAWKLPFLLLLLLSPRPGVTTQVQIFRAQSESDFLGGTLEGVAIDRLGRLQLADRAERLTSIQEPFLFDAVSHPDGWVVGTGDEGSVLHVDRKGNVSTLMTAEQPEVFAVWADADGTVFAGSSPDGKVYRIDDGEVSEFFDPDETYIWDLARDADGALLVATGTQGKLYRVDTDGEGEVVFDSHDTHVRSLAVLGNGDVLLGTAGAGLIVRLGRDGSIRTLYDADQPEVVSLAEGSDGTTYAAVVASEASWMDHRAAPQPAQTQADQQGAQQPAEPGAQVSVQVLVGAEMAAGSRPPGFTGPRSELLKIGPRGLVETLWSFDEETVYSLLWHRGRLWVATGLEGKLYGWRGDQMVLEKDADERQIVAVLADDPGPAFATTNASSLYRMVGGTERQGTYTGPVVDAGQLGRFGSFRWDGELPSGAGLKLSFRTGMSSEPDQTWSPWTAPRDGRELSLSDLPKGRYLEWRAHFEANGGRSPRIHRVEVSYRQENLPPRIKSFRPLDPGQVLVPANFNPASQVFEPAHPNRQGIFTTLGEGDGAEDKRRVKALWKYGYQTLRWEAEDANGDELRYDLFFRKSGHDGDWLRMAEDLEDDHYSFDATALPDGSYRFRLVASDWKANLPEEEQTADQVSEPVLIDHTPPDLVSVERDGGQLRVRIRDGLSPLREASYSVDAGEWKPASTADGLLDGQTEGLVLEPSSGSRVLLLRVMDAAFNVKTFDLSEELP